MKRIVEKALAETAGLWRPIQTAFRWVHAAAHVLANDDGADKGTVQRRFGRVLQNIALFCQTGRILQSSGNRLKRGGRVV